MTRVAIIGGGIGGLTSALLLHKQGIDVTVFERSSKVGGRIVFEEEGPYRIDQGPTIVLLPEMIHSILEEAGISRDRLELLRCDPLYRIHYHDGKALTKRADTQAQVTEIESIFPGEGRGFKRFMADLDAMYPAGQAGFLEKGFQRKRDFFTPKLMYLMLKMQAHKSIRGAVGQYFRSEELKDAYSLQSLYIGGSPFETPGIYSLLPYAEHKYGVWMVKGGYGSLPELLSEELVTRKIPFQLNTEVESIIVKNAKFTGVKVNGQIESFDAVIYNGEFPHLKGLIEGSEVPAKKKVFRPSSGCVLVYLGVERRWEESMTHQFFLPPSLNTSLREIFLERKIASSPSFYVFNPVALDEKAAPSGHSVMYFLIPVPDAQGVDWDIEVPSLVDKVLQEAEDRGFQGLREAIRWKKIRTPQDAEQDGLFGGGSFGIAPTLSQSGVFRPQSRPYSIEGLYTAGASVHPGGGVPIVMQGARLAVNQLMKEMSL
ncbi:phytoene desaturase family protein [Paenibacillus antarcticus]|uniref:Phytoene desaturase n=1 Tax=Paenibacillus antarcticus TaxID=253703 RepID=A0A168QD68_9BACL|nr:phytoene desaturase family protein [Paenibacillus antarcticus]OAB47652.1 phytoene desaturase [Paenibacillus antarcticus]